MLDTTRPCLALIVALLCTPLAAQQSGELPGRVGGPDSNREQMWPAPTAEDWAKPCLIPWQRTWEDAVAVARETGKPILIAVNMDGEIASEHYAGVLYRQPEVAALFEPYVCVIASVYRHTPRDYDEQGRRIPCPRFGTVTCGEHVWIEPKLFGEYFEDTRVAPRHIMVELDGAEVYDVYYAWDTRSVFQAISDGIAERDGQPPAVVRGDRSLSERIASKDSTDRAFVERSYRQGDRETRRGILETAAALGAEAPVEVLRLGVYDVDAELNRLARQALAQADSELAAPLIADALRAPLPAEEREDLVGALERIGEESKYARTLATTFRGLSGEAATLDAEAWVRTLDPAQRPEYTGWSEVEARLERAEEAVAARPEDPQARVDEAVALLDAALTSADAGHGVRDVRTATRLQRLQFEDARRAARAAAEQGAEDWRVDAVLAVCADRLGDEDTAAEHARGAVDALPAGDGSRLAAETLRLFAAARQEAIAARARAGKSWPSEWVADVHAAYRVLARHPLAGAETVRHHVAFLDSLGAAGQAADALQQGLRRFPDAPQLHALLRRHALRERGPEALGEVYDRLLEDARAHPHLPWYAGVAAVRAAEIHRRGGASPAAEASYDRAEALFRRSMADAPGTADSASHWLAVALAGRARLALETGDLDSARDDLLAAFHQEPAAADDLDGLNVTPVMTAQMLVQRLRDAGRAEDAARVQAALDELAEIDPRLLDLPAYDQPQAGPSPDARDAGSPAGDPGPSGGD